MFFEGAISADSHIVEPPNCYIDHIDPKFRDRAPRIERHPDGRDHYVIEGVDKMVPLTFLDGADKTPSQRQREVRNLTFDQVRPGAYDPNARVLDLDRDGIEAEIIYASIGMVLSTHPDIAYRDACMQAYNRWLEGFCSEQPERLFGLAQTSVTSVDAAIEDFRRAKSQGFVGMMMTGDPVHEDYDHPDYDALWECASDLKLPICFHILTSKGGTMQDAFISPRGHRLNAFMSIIRAVQDVLGMMVLGGVFERHPNLKLVLAESDAGWMPHYSYRMDHAAHNASDTGILDGLSKMPSDYIRSNVWNTFQDDWVAFQTKDMVNYRQLLWANDYPHSDSTWPNSQSLLAKHAGGLSEAERNAILRDNAVALFDLPLARRQGG